MVFIMNTTAKQFAGERCSDCKILLSGYRSISGPHPYLVEKSKTGTLAEYECLICLSKVTNESDGIASVWR